MELADVRSHFHTARFPKLFWRGFTFFLKFEAHLEAEQEDAFAPSLRENELKRKNRNLGPILFFLGIFFTKIMDNKLVFSPQNAAFYAPKCL
jgi:hypothetical protein